ncbi:Uncharacterised protein r2_g4291 [Pycnogonum litorale]
MNTVIDNIESRFKEIKNNIEDKFSFLWKYQIMSEDELAVRCKDFSKTYQDDIKYTQLQNEMLDMKNLIHPGNFGNQQRKPLDFIHDFMLSQYFSKIFKIVYKTLQKNS